METNPVGQIERRYKILSVPDQRIMDLVTIPEGSSVISVHHNYISQCFEIVIYNNIFDIVPAGYIIPHLPEPEVKTF